MDQSDDQQIRRWLDEGRPRDAFELLVHSYQHKVFRLAFAIVGDAGLAEDAAQEAFLRVWKALPNFRGDSALSTWIYAIARNCSLSLIESRRARAADSIEEPGVRLRLDNRLAAASAPSRALFDVAALVAQLRPQYRQVLRLYYMEERSYVEVAALLDLPLGTVKTTLHRARLELATALATLRSGSSANSPCAPGAAPPATSTANSPFAAGPVESALTMEGG
jgi:RNA polymerase sigma-70 factor (ECF subfamily)